MGRIPLKEGLLTTIDPAADPRLLGGRCASCDELHFPAAAVCPYCSASGCSSVPLAAAGRLYVHTAVRKAPPGYRGRVPYGFGVVELPGGIRVVTRLTESDPAKLGPGDPVHLVLEEIFTDDAGNAVVGWAFAPGESA